MPQLNKYSLSIEVESPEHNYSKNYSYIIERAYNPFYKSYPFETLYIDSELNITHTFTIRYIINSTDPEIQNLSLLGNVTEITGRFLVYNNYTFNVTIDDEYLSVASIDRRKVVLPYEQEISFLTNIIIYG